MPKPKGADSNNESGGGGGGAPVLVCRYSTYRVCLPYCMNILGDPKTGHSRGSSALVHAELNVNSQSEGNLNLRVTTLLWCDRLTTFQNTRTSEKNYAYALSQQ